MDETHDNSQPERRAGILTLPTELIHNILLSLPPLCIEHFSQTCKLAREHVYGEARIGDIHLWKQLYLQRYDDFPSLWDASKDSSIQQILQGQEEENERNARSSSSSASETSSSVAHTATHSAASSVMSLVQLRERAARLYGADPTNTGPISLNFNAVLAALLSVIDTAMPTNNPEECLNTIWLGDSILSSGQNTWAQWVFPRSMLHHLDEYKIESAAAAVNRPESPQETKRRRLSSAAGSAEKQEDEAGPSSSSPSKPGPSRRRSSSKYSSERPDSGRRRSARLLKLMYPESLHGLVDQGIDIDAIAQPQMRLAARIHCLYGIRAWKDSQKSRLTESPQEIPGQRQQDGLANEGAAQASAQEASGSTETSRESEQQDIEVDAASQSANPDADEQDGNDDGEDDDDDASFDDPPAAVLRYRPRTFGPSFGFCNAPDEEDEVRARMRHRVYDAGYYGWSNGYAPLHAWRRPSEPGRRDDDGEEEEEAEDDDIAMIDAAMANGSLDGDDDAFREAAGLSDDGIPDDPVPIEIEVSRVGGNRRTFQVADRFGNPIDSEQDSNQSGAAGWENESTNAQDTAVLIGEPVSRTDRAPDQPPDLGTYDAETRTYTYEGSLPVGIRTGSDNIQVTVGDTIDFLASGNLNIQLIRPGMPIQTLHVNRGDPRSAGRNGNEAVEDEEEEQEEDDDYDEDAEDWDDDDGAHDLDDIFRPDFFGTFRPMEGAEGYRGSRADDEVKQLVEQADKANDGAEAEEKKMSLRRKSIHWELVEAIMLVMYANLKEAIWLENWGVGIKIPKIYDDSGMLVRDPMEKREFLEFPTGWISSLPVPLPSKLNLGDGPPGSPPRSPPRTVGPDNEKPHDWARCESFWAGTYAFLDYSHFVEYNVRMARRRRQAIANAQSQSGAGVKGKGSKGNGHKNQLPKPNLIGQEEAVGDCLQLRLELLPKSQQPAYNKDEEGQDDDDDYPTLFFRGSTVTYWGNEAPMPRGGVHGKVRPVYAREEDIDEIMSKGPRGKKKIEGLHWSLTHVYEGEDRWQLEGIQPGPPGTRAPIFGIWTDALHEEESPNGPFVYWMMDDRPWKEIERINRQDAQTAAAARAANR